MFDDHIELVDVWRGSTRMLLAVTRLPSFEQHAPTLQLFGKGVKAPLRLWMFDSQNTEETRSESYTREPYGTHAKKKRNERTNDYIARKEIEQFESAYDCFRETKFST